MHARRPSFSVGSTPSSSFDWLPLHPCPPSFVSFCRTRVTERNRGGSLVFDGRREDGFPDGRPALAVGRAPSTSLATLRLVPILSLIHC